MSSRWVVLDYGDVISRHTGALGQLAGMLGAGQDAFEAAYWAHRPAYDEGASDVAYWTSVGDELGIDVGDDLVHALTSTDTLGWLHVRPEMLALIHELAANGERLALLSNAPASFGAAVRQQEWSRHFRALVFSGEEKLVKPDRAIFELLCGTLAARPGDCFFTDDKRSNVDAARAAGLRAEVFTDATELRRQLGG